MPPSSSHRPRIPLVDSDLRNALVKAYASLSHSNLVLFCSLRSLPLSGNLSLTLANYDVQLYRNNISVPLIDQPPPPSPFTQNQNQKSTTKRPDLPVELIAEILDHLDDWELSTSVGVPTSHPRPLEWARASPMDEAILTGYLPLVRSFANTDRPFTRVGANAAARFGFIHIIEHLRLQHPKVFDDVFGKDAALIPLRASQFGRVHLLSWWKSHSSLPKIYSPEVVDNASKAGAVASLQWWLHHSGLPMTYTEAALEGASLKGHLSVLQWWKDSGIPLKIGKVMESASTSGEVKILEWWANSGLEQPKYEKQALYLASCHAHVPVLQWWYESGLQMIYDSEVLNVATRMNKPSVLEWWDKSGLPVPYRLCDIEEALEDAIGGGEEARAWWRRKGVDFHAGDVEWMKTQTLN